MNIDDLNKRAEMIINLANNGGNPNSVMQTLISKNPNMYSTQINQTMTQIQNMAQGRTIPEFYLQILKQNGLSEQNLMGIAKLLGVKNN